MCVPLNLTCLCIFNDNKHEVPYLGVYMVDPVGMMAHLREGMLFNCD